jgi:hypothetical protein
MRPCFECSESLFWVASCLLLITHDYQLMADTVEKLFFAG